MLQNNIISFKKLENNIYKLNSIEYFLVWIEL